MRTLRRAGIAALVAAGTACGDGTKVRRVAVGAPAPAYAARSLAGDSVSIASLRGRVTLLNVWATWCIPCRDELPALQALYEQERPRGLEIIGVSVDAEGTDADVRQMMRDFGMTFPVWRDPDERVLSVFLTIGVPSTFLIDRGGILRWQKVGPVEKGDTTLTAAIAAALGSARGS